MCPVHGIVFTKGQSLVQLFFCDLFYFMDGIIVASYTDDTTSYSRNNKNDFKLILTSFMKAVVHASLFFQKKKQKKTDTYFIIIAN